MVSSWLLGVSVSLSACVCVECMNHGVSGHFVCPSLTTQRRVVLMLIHNGKRRRLENNDDCS